MVEVRACVFLSVIFLCFHVAIGKPFFGLLGGEMYCALMCEDDDPTTTATTTEDALDVLLCSGCDTTPRTTTPTPTVPMNTAMPPNFGAPMEIMIPPSNGMNVTMWRPTDNGSWLMSFLPWAGQGPTGAPPGPGPTTAAATTAAGATTAAADATTAATTAAAGKK